MVLEGDWEWSNHSGVSGGQTNDVGRHKLTMRARYYLLDMDKIEWCDAHLKECDGYR
jgi:hypothetical protein